ncbi:hypothetical protein [Microbulbifer sp. DLAB2-AA]|uniref:hypothetical protein n=1 Tax=Microbulbifer sp. DLAB2-AA TaxID=3243394 RepID=UPI0040390A54
MANFVTLKFNVNNGNGGPESWHDAGSGSGRNLLNRIKYKRDNGQGPLQAICKRIYECLEKPSRRSDGTQREACAEAHALMKAVLDYQCTDLTKIVFKDITGITGRPYIPCENCSSFVGPCGNGQYKVTLFSSTSTNTSYAEDVANLFQDEHLHGLALLARSLEGPGITTSLALLKGVVQNSVDSRIRSHVQAGRTRRRRNGQQVINISGGW